MPGGRGRGVGDEECVVLGLGDTIELERGPGVEIPALPPGEALAGPDSKPAIRRTTNPAAIADRGGNAILAGVSHLCARSSTGPSSPSASSAVSVRMPPSPVSAGASEAPS